MAHAHDANRAAHPRPRTRWYTPRQASGAMITPSIHMMLLEYPVTYEVSE